MRRQRYKSQLQYGKDGGHICTSISYVVACSFLINHNKDPMVFFDRERMHDIMQNCSQFYAGTAFAAADATTKWMSVNDMQMLCPSSHAIRSLDIAGMLWGGPEDEANNLIVAPLDSILQKICSREPGGRVALVITYSDHTVAFLSDEKCSLYFFDPMPAELADVSHTWRGQFTRSQSMHLPARINCEYSGALFSPK